MDNGMAKYFADLAKYSKVMNENAYQQGGQSKNGSVLNLTRTSNLGNAIVRIIPDENMVPVRLAHKVYEIYFTSPATDYAGKPILKDGKQATKTEYFAVLDISNYFLTKPTPEQMALNQKAIDLLELLREYINEEYVGVTSRVGITYRGEVALFYAKLINLSQTDKGSIDKGGVRVCRHHSAKFYSTFSSVIDKKTENRGGSSSWMESYFSRSPGKSNKIISIDTTRPDNYGYTTQIQFDEGLDYEVTQEDLNTAKNLYKELWDVSKFNDEELIMITNRLRTILNDELAAEQAATSFKTIPGAAEADIHKPSTAPTMPNPAVAPVSPIIGDGVPASVTTPSPVASASVVVVNAPVAGTPPTPPMPF